MDAHSEGVRRVRQLCGGFVACAPGARGARVRAVLCGGYGGRRRAHQVAQLEVGSETQVRQVAAQRQEAGT